MADDDAQGGFDDWLEEEPGPVTDPYAALADEVDDAESEIADWMAFTSGEGADDTEPSPSATQPDDEVVVVDITETVGEDDATEEIEIVSAAPPPPESDEVDDGPLEVATSASREPDASDLDKVERIPIIKPPGPDEVPATSVDLDEFDSGARADTDEIPIIAGADILAASVIHNDVNQPDTTDDSDVGADTGEVDTTDEASGSVEGTAPMAMDAFGDEPDDTGELDVIELPGSEVPDELDHGADVEGFDRFVDDGAPAPDASSGVSDGVFDLTQEGYHGAAATSDHAGLAAAIAAADGEDTEQVALTAPMAGLESSVVGFDDVVAAEGFGRVRARGSGDLVARVITAIVLIAALAASLVWRPALVGLALVVFIIGAGEFYTAVRRSGRHPIALFGFVGIVGATLGAYAWGAIAIPMSFFLVATLLLLFYAVVPGKDDPMANLALTVSVMAWVGLGAYAMLIAVSDDYQTLVVGVVVAVAAMDIAQYFVGRALGRHQLSPWVSPKKTVEGLVGGVIVALTVGALLHFFPPFELTSGLAIGAATAVLVPTGDLAMSAAKRSLGLKDMGSILPGHGGFLDRIDGLIFVIPAAWAIFVWAGLL